MFVINHWVCERANPFMQLVYLSLVIGGYYVFVAYGFDLIGLYVHPAHAFVLPTVMTLSLMQWLRVCWSDPGVINASNLEAHYCARPFDGVLYRPKSAPPWASPSRRGASSVTRPNDGWQSSITTADGSTT